MKEIRPKATLSLGNFDKKFIPLIEVSPTGREGCGVIYSANFNIVSSSDKHVTPAHHRAVFTSFNIVLPVLLTGINL